MYGSPDITYLGEDSLSRVLIVLSWMEGKAAEWATEHHQKWATQITEQWRAASVMNMTFNRTDWHQSQLLIELTHSQIGCMDQELSQL
jgi:hypothetical protein